MCARPSEPIRQNVVFRSPPVARTAAGGAVPVTVTGSGAYPRDRRTGTHLPSAVTATTESSHATWIGRSWVSTPSIRPSSQSMSLSRNAIGDPP